MYISTSFLRAPSFRLRSGFSEETRQDVGENLEGRLTNGSSEGDCSEEEEHEEGL